MDASQASNTTKSFLEKVAQAGETWLAEEIKKIFENASDEKDFLEEVTLYLTRIEMKTRDLKQYAEKLSGF